ncbi:hypothetical protein KY284_026552 [Solanum tuberosum]|nr:hypothetical protein KY284_026552 [Solanum tuberosum]
MDQTSTQHIVLMKELEKSEVASIKEQIQLLRYGNPEPRRAQSSPTSVAKAHKEETEFDIAKLVWERKDAKAAQKRAEEAQARSKRKKVADPGAMMILSYKAPNDDSIFVDLSPNVEELTISDHEKLDSEKEWDSFVEDITNGEDMVFQTHSFLDPILGMNYQVVHELYSLKDDSPTNDYLSAIDDYLRCYLNDLSLEHLDDIDLEHDTEDSYPVDGYIEDSKSSTDS